MSLNLLKKSKIFEQVKKEKVFYVSLLLFRKTANCGTTKLMTYKTAPSQMQTLAFPKTTCRE